MSRAPERLTLCRTPDQAVFANARAGSAIVVTFDSRLISVTTFICFQS